MKLQIEKMMYGGAGLAHSTEGDGAARAVLCRSRCRESWSKLSLQKRKATTKKLRYVKVLSASEDRVQPGCKHFGECGGCHYQHAKYPAQLSIKQRSCMDTLEHVALTDCQRYRLTPRNNGATETERVCESKTSKARLRVGYNRRGSNQFLAIQECPIFAPLPMARG